MSSLCNVWVALLLGSCAAAPPERTTSTEPTSTEPTSTEPAYRARPGVIESVDEIAPEPVASTASGDVLLKILVGGLLFSDLLFPQGPGIGTEIIVGAENGRSPIVPSDGVSTTLPRYQVIVRFDDGGSMTLVYTVDVPFHRGERVVLTQHGLVGA